MNYDEIIVTVARETGWSLEYIRGLPLRDLRLFYQELAYQRSVEDYRTSLHNANLICTLINLNSKRKYKAQDIIGPPPERPKETKQEIDLWSKAEKAGIKLPAERD